MDGIMARKIVITSGKGGVGKTTVTANLGAALASRGFRVALMDVDIGLNNLDVAMGIENKVVYDIVDVVENRCRPKQALIQDEVYSTLYTMPSSHSYDKTSVSGLSIKNLTDRLAQSFDYVLLDCPWASSSSPRGLGGGRGNSGHHPAHREHKGRRQGI